MMDRQPTQRYLLWEGGDSDNDGGGNDDGGGGDGGCGDVGCGCGNADDIGIHSPFFFAKIALVVCEAGQWTNLHWSRDLTRPHGSKNDWLCL